MAAIVQAGANQPLSFTVGDDVSLRLTVTENAVAYDWTGATVTNSIIANGAPAANFTTATSVGGILDLSLTDTQTTTLGLGTFDYWVKVTKAGITSTWVAGQLTMHAAQYGSTSNLSSTLAITTAASTTLAITLSGGGATFSSGLTLTEQTAPSTPAANNVVVYAVADNTQTRIKAKTDAGIVYDLGPSDQWKHKPTRSFMRRMRQGNRPQTVVIMGDSTGAGTGKWVYPLMQSLGTRFAAYTVKYWEWDDTMQGWRPAAGLAPTIQTGTAGEAYHITNATSIAPRANAVAASTGYNVVGDQSHRFKFQPNGTWTSIMCGTQYSGVNQKSRQVTIDSLNRIVWQHSVDGVTWNTSVNSSAAVPFAAGQKGWIRVDLDVDNGSAGHTITFYSSTDEVTWTQFGATRIVAGTTSVFGASTSPWFVLGGDFFSDTPAGKGYEYKIFNGISSTTQTLVLAWCAGDTWASSRVLGAYNGQTDICGNEWVNNSIGTILGYEGAPTLNVRNASVPGMSLTYFDDTTVVGRFAKMNTGRIDLTFISLSHNESAFPLGGDSYRTSISTFLTMISNNAPYGGIVLVGQNPKTPYPGAITDTNWAHLDRIRALNDLAAAGNHGWIDAYEALAVDTATYVSVDGSHPTTAGYALWATVAEAFIDQA